MKLRWRLSRKGVGALALSHKLVLVIVSVEANQQVCQWAVRMPAPSESSPWRRPGSAGAVVVTVATLLPPAVGTSFKFILKLFVADRPGIASGTCHTAATRSPPGPGPLAITATGTGSGPGTGM